MADNNSVTTEIEHKSKSDYKKINFSEFRNKNFLITHLKSTFFLLLGAFLSALALNIFYLPFKFTMGGLSGISAIIYYIIGEDVIPFGTLTFILNIPLLLLGLKFINLKFVIKSLVGIFFFSAVIDLCDPMMKVWFKAIYQPLQQNQLPDLLIFAIVGGIIFGFGLGFFFLGGYTTGGTDIVAVIINKIFPGLSIGQSILLIDIFIVSLTLIIPAKDGSTTRFIIAMFSFISLYISTKAIDICISGFNFCRAAVIISDYSETIAQAILTNLDRGVTGLNGSGMYTHQNKTVLFCVLPNRQIKPLRDLVSAIDPNAFIVVGDAQEVYGQGFNGTKELF